MHPVRFILILVATFGLGMAACSDDPDDPPATPVVSTTAQASATPPAVATPSPVAAVTATPAGAPCPTIQAACTLARSLQAALAANQIETVGQMAAVRTITCPGGRPQGPGGPFPLCEGAPAGEARTGIGIARRYSEGAVVSEADYRRILTQILEAVDGSTSDPFGPGALQLYAVSCSDQASTPENCARFAVIFSAILKPAAIPPLGTTPGRELLIFYGSPPPAGQSAIPVTDTWTGVILPDEAAIILNGGMLFDLGRVFRYQ